MVGLLRRSRANNDIWLRLAVLAVSFLAFYCFCLTPAAFAQTELSVGEYVALRGVPSSSDYGDALASFKVRSSDNAVISVGVRKPADYQGSKECFAHARGFGKATVTAQWKVLENTFDAKTGKFSQVRRSYSKVFAFVVSSGRVKGACCDAIFSGQNYKIADLFKGCKVNTSVSYLPRQQNGQFVDGAGYTVQNKGKAVRFTGLGKDVSVGYRVDSRTYRISIGSVHSQETLKGKVIAAIKKSAYVSSSLKIKSVSLRGGKLTVRFSLVNLVGKTVTSKVVASYKSGAFTFAKA